MCSSVPIKFFILKRRRFTSAPVGPAVVFELRAGLPFVVVGAAAVEIPQQGVAVGPVLTRVRAARVLLNLRGGGTRVRGVSSPAAGSFHSRAGVTSQAVPVKPGGHLHMKPSSRAWQRPPFRHGVLAQRFLCSSQWRPTKPGGQMHWYPLDES